MTKEYCWCPKNKQRYQIVSRNKDEGRVEIRTLDSSIGIRFKEEKFNERYKVFKPKGFRVTELQPKAKLECQCGATTTYGENIPSSWHSANLPCPLFEPDPPEAA